MRSRKRQTKGGAGDWTCKGCGNFNYKFRNECNKCKLPRDASPGDIASSQSLTPNLMDTKSSDKDLEPTCGEAANNGTAPTTPIKEDAEAKTVRKSKSGKKVVKGKGQRQRMKQLTQKIVQFAKRKRLPDAQRVFKQLVDEGLTPSLLTFSTFINAHVASGDMVGAEKVFQDMQASGIPANSVIYNTLCKGYRVAGNTARTAALFAEMSKQGVKPDTNTVNAHLNGCLRAGDVTDAHDVFEKMSLDWAAEPDFFTYKRVLQMLSRGLRLDALAKLHERLSALQKSSNAAVGKQGAEAALVWLHLHTGLAAALLGRWESAAEAFQKVEKAGAAAAVAPEVHLARSGGSSAEKHAEARCLPEERAQHQFHQKVFEDEMRRLRAILKKHGVLPGAKQKQSAARAPDLRALFSRTFIFGAHTNAQARTQLLGGQHVESDSTERGVDDIPNPKRRKTEGKANGVARGSDDGDVDLAIGLAKSLERAFGLDSCVGLGMFSLGSIERRFRKRLNGDFLNLQRVFRPEKSEQQASCDSRGKTAEDTSNNNKLPVKLEICSGFGEWVVAQAKAEAGMANWAALELRYDRCHGILSRMAFEDVDNLCVIGGDAAQILPRHIAVESVSHIFINFPEPPQTNMCQGAESHLHLLTADFFRQMHRVLCPGGRITILHDEHRYCCLIAKTISDLNKEAMAGDERSARSAGSRSGLFHDVRGLRGKGKSKSDFENVSGICLYHGVPGKRSGHTVTSSSYFDQLWETKDRFFLVLQKSE